MRISDWSSDVCSSDLHDLAYPASPRFCPRRSAYRAGMARRDIVPHSHWSSLLRRPPGVHPPVGRSEEHTSELQSLMRISYAVFCLKKKKHLRKSNTKSHIQKHKLECRILQNNS